METALRRLLSSSETSLRHYCDSAQCWVQDAGIESLEQLQTRAEDFAEALSLRPLELKRLQRALRATVDAPNRATECSKSAVHVQNTFLVLRAAKQHELRDLRKLQSEPVARSALEKMLSRETSPGSDLYSVASDASEDRWCALQRLATGEQLSQPMTRTVTEDDGLCKIVTNEAFPADQWQCPCPIGPALVSYDTSSGSFALPCSAFVPGFAAPRMCWPMVAPDPFFNQTVLAEDEACDLTASDAQEAKQTENSVEIGASTSVVPQPVTSSMLGLQCTFNLSTGAYQVSWTIDARRLKSSDREAVSPSFQLSFGQSVPFRIVLHPRCQHEGKGGCCFKKSGGKGRVELRCLASVQGLPSPEVTFRISVGVPGARGFQRPRDPVTHNFADKPLGGLPGGQDIWDFSRAMQKPAKTFQVTVEFSSTS